MASVQMAMAYVITDVITMRRQQCSPLIYLGPPTFDISRDDNAMATLAALVLACARRAPFKTEVFRPSSYLEIPDVRLRFDGVFAYREIDGFSNLLARYQNRFRFVLGPL